jgi:hypothetical protein
VDWALDQGDALALLNAQEGKRFAFGQSNFAQVDEHSFPDVFSSVNSPMNSRAG